jgi:glyoxylase-like metal-dependent hydrolase (beta-lactamase superfamily II)
MKVDLGGIEAVIETHPGHTPGDLIIRVPAQNITFTGDLFFHQSYPVTFDADMLGWRATLKMFAGFGKDALFVPGHGPVGGQEGIASIRSIFDDLAEYSKKMAAEGVSVSEAQMRYVVPEKFKSFGIFSWGFCIDQAVAQFHDAARKRKL